MEHRWGQRVPLEVPICLNVGGRAMGRGILRNASVSGAFIETALELPLYTSLAVVIGQSKAGKPKACELAACVVRSVLAGFAVEWRNMGCTEVVALVEGTSGQNLETLPGGNGLAPT